MWCVGVGNVDVACDLLLDVCMVCGVSGVGNLKFRVIGIDQYTWHVSSPITQRK